MSDHIGPFIVERWPDAQAMGAAYHCETLERVTLKSSNTSPDLSSEAKVLRSLSGGAGIPALHWFGKSHGQMMMITEMAGDPLEDIFNQGGRYFELQILLEFAHQLICRLEWIHSRSVSHGNLNPAILTLGASSWQAPQVTISNFGTAESSQFAPRKDLEDIGDIIIYFATAYTSWDSFKASKRHEQEVPSFLMAYFAIIRSQDLNLADYSTIRNHFDSARQLLNRTLFGGISDPEQQHLSLKNLSLKSTGDLFEDLGVNLVAVGQMASLDQSLWAPTQAGSIAQSLDGIMAIYLVLLMRDRPSQTKQRYVMGAFHLPNRLWRDLRWYLCMASHGSISFQRLIGVRIYKFICVLLEVIPMYNKFWTVYLSELACAQMALDRDSCTSWKQACVYWKDCASFLKRRCD